MKKILLFGFILFISITGYALGYGDVNNDGIINSPDYVLVKKYIMKKGTLTDDQLKSANINKDKTINSQDYILIKKRIMSGETKPEHIAGTSQTPTGTSSNPTPTPTAVLRNVTPTPSAVPRTPTTSSPTPTTAPTPTPTPVPSLSAEETACENARGNGSIDYASFASLKKDDDDYYVIKAAHDCANKYGLPVSVTKGKYSIYKKNNDTIVVETNTNLNDSTIYIHDEYDGVHEHMKTSIYSIRPNSSNLCTSNSISGFTNAFTALVPSGGKYFVFIKERDGAKVFSRKKDGEDKSDGEGKRDAYRVYDGVVQDLMFWDYTNSTIKYEACPIPSDRLVFQNAEIKTVIRYECSSCGNSFMQRGIAVERSNTKIYNVHHSFVDKDKKLIHNIKHKYTGFFKINEVADVELEKCTVYSLTCDISSSCSTYDLSAGDVAHLTLDKVKMYSDRYNDSYNQLSSSSDWGVMSSNGCKNVEVKNSSLNRIDAHKGMYTLKVKDTKIGNKGITIIGTGNRKDNSMVLDGVTWIYGNALIRLRGDYGATWNGSITIKNSKVSNPSSSTVSLVNVGAYDSNIKDTYAHPIYGPTSIKISGFTASGVSKLNIINLTKDKYKNYYIKHNSSAGNDYPTISKSNISGISTVNEYAS